MRHVSTRKLAFAAVVAAAYAALTMLLAPISYGPIQFRLSEALCILPFFFPFSAWGLFVGCALSNLLSAYGLIDIVFGSLATLLAALVTAQIGRAGRGGIGAKMLACLPPVLFNAAIIGAVIASTSAESGAVFLGEYVTFGLQVGLGELVVMAVIGLPLLIYLPRAAFFQTLLKKYGGELK